MFFTISAFSQDNIQIKKTWEVNPTFDGGIENLQKEISNTLKYVIHSNYFVDGKITMVLQINEDGKYFVHSVYPKNLQNKDAFVSDMNYMLKRSKKRWQPATTNGKPVKSFFTYNINFSMMNYDED